MTSWQRTPGCPSLPKLTSACRVLYQFSFPKIDVSYLHEPSRKKRRSCEVESAKRKKAPLLTRGEREDRGLLLPSMTNFTFWLYYYYYYVQYKRSLFEVYADENDRQYAKRIFEMRRARDFPLPRKHSIVNTECSRTSASKLVHPSSSRNEQCISQILFCGETISRSTSRKIKKRDACAKRDTKGVVSFLETKVAIETVIRGISEQRIIHRMIVSNYSLHTSDRWFARVCGASWGGRVSRGTLL